MKREIIWAIIAVVIGVTLLLCADANNCSGQSSDLTARPPVHGR